MKPGRIDQFAHLSKFHSIKHFNETMNKVRKQYEHRFTKGEQIALLTLIQFSVKTPGICNARISKLVQAAQANNGTISRSTFERMLQKAKALGIISIHHTVRQKGGYSHNVYVFHPYDGAQGQQLTDRPTAKNEGTPSHTTQESASKAILIQTKKQKDKDQRSSQTLNSEITLETLDHTFVPSYVPMPFVHVAKPFFNRAKDICSLWDRAVIAYRSMSFAQPIETLLPTIIEAFKETVYKYKQNYIKTSFIQYFYGTVVGKLAVEKRKMVVKKNNWGNWLEGNG